MKSLNRSRLTQLVVEVYADPDPCASLENFARARHEDLPGLSLEAIDRERLLARLRWALDPDDSSWLRDRLARLDLEADRRRQRGRP